MPALLRTHEFGITFDCNRINSNVFIVSSEGGVGVSFQDGGTYFREYTTDNGATWNPLTLDIFWGLPGVNENDFVQIRTTLRYVRKSAIDYIDRQNRVYTYSIPGTSYSSTNIYFDNQYYRELLSGLFESLNYRRSYVQTTEPTAGIAGDLWFNPTTDQLHIYEE